MIGVDCFRYHLRPTSSTARRSPRRNLVIQLVTPLLSWQTNIVENGYPHHEERRQVKFLVHSKPPLPPTLIRVEQKIIRMSPHHQQTNQASSHYLLRETETEHCAKL